MNSERQFNEQLTVWKASGLTKSQIIINEAEYMLGWPYVWGAVGAPCTVAKREYYMGRSQISSADIELIRKHCQVLNGSKGSCTGCKYFPHEERTDINDCQGFVKMLHKAVGITLSGGGCTSMWNDSRNWTEKGVISNMPKDKVCCVFQWNSEKKNMQHIGEYIGNGQIIHCSTEVKYGKTTDRAWTHYAIPKGLDGGVPVWRPTIRKGSQGEDVKYCQEILDDLGYDIGSYGADGKFGAKTKAAVQAFQRDHELNPDGVVGPLTWEALEAAKPEGELYTVTIPHLTKPVAEALVQQYAGASKEKEEEYEDEQSGL